MTPRQVTGLLIVDHYTLFYTGLVLAASSIVVLLSFNYLKKLEGNREEYYALLLIAVLGSAVLIASSHFASLFLGLEILSVSLYALIAYVRPNQRGIEAGIKYLILAAASAAFLLFGIALIYTELGSLSFPRIVSGAVNAQNLLLLTGTAMVVVGVGFKLAVVPFHMWTPDVYEGAPAPVTAFIATVSKGAVFALLLRYFTFADIRSHGSFFLIFSLIAAASMFFGNLLALLQNNVKRILAYSSISHLGYLMVAFLAGGSNAYIAVTFYLVAYFVTTLGAFGIIAALSGSKGEPEQIENYHGMAWRRPWLAGIFVIMMLSLAGIPLTAGFIGKFYVVRAGTGSALWTLVVMLVVNSAIGLFYYLRVISALFMTPEAGAQSVVSAETSSGKTALTDNIVLSALAVALFWLGSSPSFFIDTIVKIGSKFID
jgi:NADH-quinone oxidoreductase subunit N